MVDISDTAALYEIAYNFVYSLLFFLIDGFERDRRERQSYFPSNIWPILFFTENLEKATVYISLLIGNSI